MGTQKKLLVVAVAGFGWDFSRKAAAPGGLTFRRTETIFPALTCPVQASFRTAALPFAHGMVGNGLFFKHLHRVMFWEQSAGLVIGPRIWDAFRAPERRVGMMFWQQSLGEAVDLVLSPRPIHRHHGGMIQDCYGQPPDLYERLCAAVGRPFNLMHYWGPLASAKSSGWIADATAAVMQTPGLAPELLLSYLPHLDYDLQRFGPDSARAFQSLEKTLAYLSHLRNIAETAGYDWLFFGDYAIESVTGGPLFPNLALRDAGLFQPSIVRGMAYPDFHASPAFAVADHQIAHVFAAHRLAAHRAEEVLGGMNGVAEILDRAAQKKAGLDVARSGDLVLVAEKGSWFAYPWWRGAREEPDFASHVDIHNKPGYDPCELFLGWPPGSVSRDPARVRGTHGRRGPDTSVAWASSLAFDEAPSSVIDLSRRVQEFFSAGVRS